MKSVCARIIFLAPLIFAACNGSKSQDKGAAPGQPGAAGGGSVAAETFLSDCISGQGDSFYRLLVTIAGNQVTGMKQVFDEAECMGYQSRKDEPVSGLTVKDQGDNYRVLSDGTKVFAINKKSHYSSTGDFADYAGTATFNGVSKPISLFAQVIGRSPFGIPFMMWNWEDGIERYPRSNAWISSDNSCTIYYAQMMHDCKKIETITVPAGTFKTCRFDTNDGKERVWYGNVPVYGIVKVQKDEGVEMKEFYFSHLAEGVGLDSKAAISISLKSVGF